MNTIRNYLDNMFRNLPNTEAVRKAKAELLQMMEDKYDELIKEGKTDNEAVGIVISEFGNLDELAESLGIGEQVTESADEAKPMLSMDRVKEYLNMISQRSILIPLGIALCIFCSAFNIIADMTPLIPETMGVSAMFLAIAAAVILFVIARGKRKEFNEIYDKQVSLSIESAEYVRSERKRFRSGYGLMSSIGIGLCILSVVNPIIIGSIPYVKDSFGAVMLFLFISLGVFLITSSHAKMKGYDRILELNEAGKMSEEFVPKSDRKVNKAPIIVCAIIAVAVAVTVGGMGAVRSVISGLPVFNFGEKGSSETMGTTYDISAGETNDISSIKLDLSACSVVFEQAEGSGLVDVEYTGSKSLRPEVKFENGKLTASQPNTFSLGFKSVNSPRLVIKLGSDVKLDNLEMKVNAGNIDIKNVTADYLFGNFNAGNVVISNCNIRKADIDADAGNINISDSDMKIVKIDTDAGNIDLNKTTSLEQIEIKTDFGSVKVGDIENLDQYDIECKVDAGMVRVGGASGGRKYNSKGSGKGTIKVKVDAGNIEIN